MLFAMRFLHHAARWLFLAALVYAPWAYGCTIPWTLRGLNWILAAALGAQSASYLSSAIGGRRRRLDNRDATTNSPTTVAWALILPSAVLLLLGWWMAFNARWIYDSDF